MSLRNRLRRVVAILFYVPFVTLAAIRYAISTIGRSKRPAVVDGLPENDPDSLSNSGMTGDLRGTVVTFFARRQDVESLLPPELTIVDDDMLPDWVRESGGHPVIAIIGSNEIGIRKRILGEYHTVPLFRTFLETMIAVPFLRPVDSDQPTPCFHFPRVYCETFWPTELGLLCAGWPKLQCRMRLRQDGDERQYVIEKERGGEVLLSATTNMAAPADVDTRQQSFRRIVEMFAQPLVLIKNRKLRKIDWNLRLNSAKLKSVAADLTLYPGFFPSANDSMSFSFPGVTECEFGAFYMETTYLNRGEV
jgi:hypothetical protein